MTTRDIRQLFWRSEHIPWAELRSTRRSRQAYKLHQHPQLSIGAIVEGETVTCCAGKSYHLRAGDMILIGPGVPHSCNPAGGPRSYHMLYLDEQWCKAQLGLPAFARLHCSQTVLRDVPLFTALINVLTQMQENNLTALPAALRGLLFSLPGLESQACGNPYGEMQQALLADYQSPPSLESLAKRYHLRKETLIRHFKQATGMTPGAWLNNARVEFAKARLRAGETLTDVGYQSGFADQSHFHRTFVSFTASTPRQYAQGRSIFDNN